MSNEHLGIYEELRAKSKPFEERSAERKRSLQVGTWEPIAQEINPFERPSAPVVRVHAPAYHRMPSALRRREVHPEAELNINIAQVIRAVCEETETSHADLVSDSRKRRVAYPRHIAMYMIDVYCPQFSLTQIAYIFKRDHTTVIHGIRKTTQHMIEGDTWTRAMVANIKQRLAALVEATNG